MVDLGARCETLHTEAHDKLQHLAGEIDEELFQALRAELQEAVASPLRSRLAALQKVSSKIKKELQHLEEMRRALAAAARALGLDPSQLRGKNALMEEMRRLRSQLLERRARALQILEEAGQPIQYAEDDPEYLKALAAEVEALEARVLALQAQAMKAASQARHLGRARRRARASQG